MFFLIIIIYYKYNNNMNTDFLFKIIVLGDSGVGKTSLLSKIQNNNFSHKAPSTIGLDFFNFIVAYNEHHVKLQIYDTAGQERFKSIIKAFYHSSHAIIFVADATSEQSFVALKHWIRECDEHATSNPIKFLVVNKADADNKINEITINNYAEIYDLDYVIISAKNEDANTISSKIFTQLVSVLIKNEIEKNKEKSNLVDLSSVYNNTQCCNVM
jgi:Ras-related protein Rab-1A